MNNTAAKNDVIFVGGGLANTLAAWRLHTTRPDVSWRLFEAGQQLGGGEQDRTWSFHLSDLGLDPWLAKLSPHQWAGYDVVFPNLERGFDGTYCSIRSSELHVALAPLMGDRIHFGSKVETLTPTSVTTTSGETFETNMVVDGRGLGSTVPYACAYQKFTGLNVQLSEPHGLTRPLLMDARVQQTDGYRFVYILPWSANTLLVEDTYYSQSPTLPVESIVERVKTYISQRQWTIAEVLGVEQGILPIPLAGANPPEPAKGIAGNGVAAGRFHPTTGYSVAHATRFADRLAAATEFSPTFADRLNVEAKKLWDDGDFYRRLNNMMFHAGKPHERWRIMETFYRRGPRLIARFYRGKTSARDQIVLLSGKPPVPMLSALAAFVKRHRNERSQLA